MLNQDVLKYFTDLIENQEFKKEFKQLPGKSFVLSRNQNKFIVEKSNGLLSKTVMNKELNRRQDYFKDTSGNYYDLRVGNDENTGSIDFLDLLGFGYGEEAKTHYYICINKLLNKAYIINAKDMFDLQDKLGKNCGNGKLFIGEKDYCKYFDAI